jgi:DNA-binding response OmpR family regulator
MAPTQTPKKILYVDDEETLRLLVKNQLTNEGYDVQIADDGDVALDMLSQSPQDLVLLDIRMPRMSGVQVLEEFKKRGIKPRIIMLTAVDDLSVAIQCVKLGANDYLTKPFDLEHLLGAINRVLAR